MYVLVCISPPASVGTLTSTSLGTFTFRPISLLPAVLTEHVRDDSVVSRTHSFPITYARFMRVVVDSRGLLPLDPLPVLLQRGRDVAVSRAGGGVREDTWP